PPAAHSGHNRPEKVIDAVDVNDVELSQAPQTEGHHAGVQSDHAVMPKRSHVNDFDIIYLPLGKLVSRHSEHRYSMPSPHKTASNSLNRQSLAVSCIKWWIDLCDFEDAKRGHKSCLTFPIRSPILVRNAS